MAHKLDYSEKYDVFLSYRRDGGETMAILLRDRLTAKGYKVFLDVESLRSGAFNAKLLRVIEGCTDFLTVLSKGSLDRCVNEGDWVRREIAHALKNEKNVAPIMLRGFEWPDKLPEDMADLPNRNGIDASNNEYFDAAVDRLVTHFLESRPRKKAPKIKWWISAAAVAVIALVIGAVLLFSPAEGGDDDVPVSGDTGGVVTQTPGGNAGVGDEDADNISSDIKVGDIVTFGAYEWRVLDVQDGKALITTKDVLEKREYHAELGSEETWETCDLRKYLNKTFFAKFSDTEKSRIVQVTNTNADNSKYHTKGGNSTTDTVFLLSIDEAKKYFTSDADRVVKDDGLTFSWWLRSPGEDLGYAAYVYGTGDLSINGWRLDGSQNVRPAMWVKLEGLEQDQSGDGESVQASGESSDSNFSGEKIQTNESNSGVFNAAELHIGSYLNFGKCEWVVLDIQENKALILTRYCLSKMTIEVFSDQYVSFPYSGSNLRDYIDREYFNEFSSQDQSRIIQTTINDYGTTLYDHMFLLSIDEAKQYLVTQNGYDASYFGHAYMSDSEPVAWWLRSNGLDSSCIAYIRRPRPFNYDVDIDTSGVNVYDYTETMGIRPACWIELDAAN